MNDDRDRDSADDDAPIPSSETISVADETAVFAPPTLESADAPRVRPLPPSAHPRFVGPYRIERELARGGMGVVYKAVQVGLNRTVALKMMLAGAHASDGEIQRFKIEAEAAAHLDHSGIVPIYEIGEADGQVYFSMGFVEGDNLAHKIAEGPLSGRQAALYLRQICDAVHYAHERGVIHRDLKPANVLLDEAGHPKVTDFGLAKKQKSDSALTATGQVMGTPSYMPPEQAGGASDIGPQADVYALGATLYALTTGRPPFQAATMMETLLQVIGQEPVAPRQLNPAIDKDLETITLKCLEKDPNRRYGSARRLAEDLSRYLAGEPIHARPSSRWEQTIKWARRRPAVAMLLATTLTALLIGIAATTAAMVYALQGWNEAESARRDAKTSEASAKNALSRLEQETEFGRIRLYDAQMSLTRDAWEDAQIVAIEDLLDEQAPDRQRGVDRRGFEWFYWQRLIRSGHETFKDRVGSLRSAAYCPVGERLAFADLDKTIRVWDMAVGKEVLTLKGHAKLVKCVAFSADGRRLASAGEDRIVKIWNALTGQEIGELKSPIGLASSIAFSPDGRRLVAVALDNSVKIWDATTGEEALTCRHRDGFVCSVAFSPVGGRAASCGFDQLAKVWDVETGEEVFALKGHAGTVQSVAFSPDGQRLASAGDDQSVKIWSLATGQEILTLKGHARPIKAIAFSPDGGRLASGGEDNVIKIWDAAAGREIHSLKGHGAPVARISFHSDGRRLVSSSTDGAIKIWDVVEGQGPFVSRSPTDAIYSVAFSPDSRRLACAFGNSDIKIWDVVKRQEILALENSLGSFGVAFSPDGRRLVSAHSDRVVKMWDADSGAEILALEGHEAPVQCAAFSPDGRRVASGSWDKTIKLRDAATGRETLTLKGHAGTVAGIAFSPDSRRLASASHDRTVRIWDAATGQELLTLKDFPGATTSVAFSSDGRRLATAGHANPIQIWDASTGREILKIQGQGVTVMSIAFSPDGRRLASGDDRTIKIWDTATSQGTLILKDQDSMIMSIAFSPDGHRLAAGSLRGAFKIWDASPLPAPGSR